MSRATLKSASAIPAGFDVRPLRPFGVEIIGDLSKPLSQEAAAWFVDQVNAHGLMLARNQSMTSTQQKHLVSHFGPVMKEMDYVDPNDGILNTDALAYHSDMSWCPKPTEMLSLHAVDVVDNETSTLFASGFLAYERLSPAQRDRLSQLTAAMVSNKTIVRVVEYDIPAKAIRFDRPAIIPHRVTGEPIVYINESQTARFNELNRADSNELLTEVFEILYAPDAVLEHAWTNGDLIVWDNISIQHGRRSFHHVRKRKLQRACVGELGVMEQYPNFVYVDPREMPELPA